jgi:predicted AAA+ superfamily ATPase
MVYFISSMSYHTRLISEKLTIALQTYPIVLLTGARQIGKTTLIKNEKKLKERSCFSCDNPQILLSLHSSIEEILTSQPFISLDEAQRAPYLFPTLKRIVDEECQNGRFLISGSRQFHLIPNSGNWFSTRAVYVRILPVTLFELVGDQKNPALYTFFKRNFDVSCFSAGFSSSWNDSWLCRGGYPELAWNPSIDSYKWFEAYEAMFLEYELHSIAAHINPCIYRRFLQVVALRNGSILNQASIAQEANLTNITSGRYLKVLEIAGLIHRIPPFSDDSGKRFVKSPRFLMSDVAMAAHFAGIPHVLEDEKNPHFGLYLKNFVLQNLFALVKAYIPGPMNLFHLRTAAGFEIDAILELNGNLVAVEIQSSRDINNCCATDLVKFMESNKSCKAGIIAYRGERLQSLGKNIWAIPIAALLT